MTSQWLKWRVILFTFVMIVAAITMTPNFVQVSDNWWFSKEKIKYGLDIQGGLHLVMGVDTKSVMLEKLSRTGESLKQELSKENVTLASSKADKLGNVDALILSFVSTEESAKAKEYIEKNYYNLQKVEEKDNTVTYKFIDSFVFETQKATLEQAIETIRNRIDEFGVAEPSITAQGSDRIMIQLPGLKEAQRAKELINRTARLDFHIVSDKMNADELQKIVSEAEKELTLDLKTMKYSEYVRKLNDHVRTKLPENTKVLFSKADNTDKMELGKIPYLLETTTNLSGDSVRDASVTMGQFNEPEVALGFNAEGAHRMSEVSGANVGRLMAIVLDDVVVSAPQLKSKIPDGRASITLGGGRDYQAMFNEAKIIAMSLRAGALPARLEELEERTVGPSLGADSVQSGQKAAIIGFVIIAILMMAYYKVFGFVANLALVCNAFLIYAILSMLGATLTLPGLGGIALTVGMAVDANIIINERIKEELAKGASFMAAVKEGYDKAWSAILDSNLTTAATSLVLFYFGTGPVRGFAVTLLIGIVTTMFTSVFMTHMIFDVLFGKYKVKKLAI